MSNPPVFTAFPWRRALAGLGVVSTALWAPSAWADVDDPIVFSQSGQVLIYLLHNQGGFDHIVEPVIVGGNGSFFADVPTPYNQPPDYPAAWIVGTEGDPLSLVGDPGAPRSPTVPSADTAWGYFDYIAGQEITLRMTNVLTTRIGGLDPDAVGIIESQLFTGTSAPLNTRFSGGSVLANTPGAPDAGSPLPGGYSFVTFTSATQIDVALEDLDPLRPIDDRWKSMTLRFVLSPVPEPGTWLLMALGLAAMGVRRRAGR